MSDIVYFKQDGTDVDVTISEVGLNAASLAALETISLSTATLAALETISISGTTTVSGTVSLHADTLSALETITVGGTVSLSTASLSALETISITGNVTLATGGSTVAGSNPLPFAIGPIGDSVGTIDISSVTDTAQAIVGTGSGLPLAGEGVVEHLGLLIKNGSGGSTVVSIYWSNGTASKMVLARSKVTIPNGDNAHINFPPGTYSTNNAYLSVASTATSGVTANSHYHQIRKLS